MGDVPRSPRGSRAGTLPCADVRLSSSCTSPQVERRDPLGVGLRPGCGDCRVAGKTARDKPSVARPAARRYAQGIRPHFYTVRRGRRKRAPRYSEVTDFAPSPVLARCWLKYGSPSTGLRTSLSRGGRIPVGDATALGTLRTRLETRTKESNMYASHWDLSRDLKA